MDKYSISTVKIFKRALIRPENVIPLWDSPSFVTTSKGQMCLAVDCAQQRLLCCYTTFQTNFPESISYCSRRNCHPILLLQTSSKVTGSESMIMQTLSDNLMILTL